MRLSENACFLCARSCGTDRTKSAGRCGGRDQIAVARAALHMWEEPCISGKRGSGAVFFAGCPLGCIFCQNREIAFPENMKGSGAVSMTPDELAGVFLRLQSEGAHNINLVTPTHFVPPIIGAVRTARAEGLAVPVVYNTGSYERPQTIAALDGTVDVFLPDLKFMDPALSGRYAHAPDYFAVAARAVDLMAEIAGDAAEFDSDGMMRRGMIVRHMVLPGRTKDSMAILKYLYGRYGDRVWLSILNQYTPMAGVEEKCPELGRRVTAREYAKVVDFAISLGIRNAFIQEGGTAEESFIPSWGMDGEKI